MTSDNNIGSVSDDAVIATYDLSIYMKLLKYTVYKLAQEGSIPAQRVGKHGQFTKSAVDRWLQSHDSGAEEHRR